MNAEIEIKKLIDAFGGYRAEWLKDENVFNLFTKPFYFAQIESSQPCVLQGGRGSGKTTVLKGLSYQGQFKFNNSNINDFEKNINYVGIYHRIDTNHVRSFEGDEISKDKWARVFSHYFNLVICRELVLFLDWYIKKTNQFGFYDEIKFDSFMKSLHIDYDKSKSILDNIESAFFNFQIEINNISSIANIKLSMRGQPIEILVKILKNIDNLKNKDFFIILDEYENYTDYQQKIVNTLIKHFNRDIIFKIGVRELGWRIKETLNNEESLNCPADYEIIDIERIFIDKPSHFKKFANEVCEQRIKQVLNNENLDYSLEKSLLNYSIEDEAIELGVEETKEFKKIDSIIKKEFKEIDGIKSHLKYILAMTALYEKKKGLREIIKNYIEQNKKWDYKYNNYGYAYLFKIKKSLNKPGISKYYAGFNTYLLLSSGNIRHLMELLYNAYYFHITKDNKNLAAPIKQSTQTKAAENIAEKNIFQLENQFSGGEDLTKLLLSIGEIFHSYAEKQGAPEITQFTINYDNSENESNFKKLLSSAVMNTALIRYAGNKLNKDETRDFIYAIHPIFAPFFKYSYRRKRKKIFNLSDLFNFTTLKQKETIRRVLKCEDDKHDNNQLNLFK